MPSTRRLRRPTTATLLLIGETFLSAPLLAAQAPEPDPAAVLHDRTPPTAPSGLTVTALTSDTLSLVWNPSTDNVGIAGYDVYLDGVAVGSSSRPFYTVTELGGRSSFTLSVAAWDDAQHLSARSETLIVTTASAGGPGDPANPPTLRPEGALASRQTPDPARHSTADSGRRVTDGKFRRITDDKGRHDAPSPARVSTDTTLAAAGVYPLQLSSLE